MAESALDRLKRLAAEKKAQAAQPVQASAEGGATSDTQETKSVGLAETKVAILSMQLSAVNKQVTEELKHVNQQARPAVNGTGRSSTEVGETSNRTEPEVLESVASEGVASAATSAGGKQELVVNSSSDPVSTGQCSTIGTSSHPLAMQFAELEQALLAKDPEFKNILRQIHRHLGQEPELVTQMTEEEIQMVVSGLVVFANAEIVAPAAAKTAKAKIAAAKKQPISADDL